LTYNSDRQSLYLSASFVAAERKRRLLGRKAGTPCLRYSALRTLNVGKASSPYALKCPNSSVRRGRLTYGPPKTALVVWGLNRQHPGLGKAKIKTCWLMVPADRYLPHLDEPALRSDGDRFCPTDRPQFFQNSFHVIFDGILTDK
jgi:hypothetical protein